MPLIPTAGTRGIHYLCVKRRTTSSAPSLYTHQQAIGINDCPVALAPPDRRTGSPVGRGRACARSWRLLLAVKLFECSDAYVQCITQTASIPMQSVIASQRLAMCIGAECTSIQGKWYKVEPIHGYQPDQPSYITGSGFSDTPAPGRQKKKYHEDLKTVPHHSRHRQTYQRLDVTQQNMCRNLFEQAMSHCL